LYFGYYDYIFIQPCHKSCHIFIFGWVELGPENSMEKEKGGIVKGKKECRGVIKELLFTFLKLKGSL
jgi:hypothetical protein